MGAGVSTWRLARAVSSDGHLGVVSGTAIDAIVARRLQVGDPGGHMRRALAAFPYPAIAQRVLDRYFIEGGKAPDAPFRASPVPAVAPSQHLLDLLVTSNFVEVWLAKEGHDGVVGINYLEKIALPNVPSIFGAMLAGVDYVLMGAGIPRLIPGILDKFAAGEPAEMPISVLNSRTGTTVRFDPRQICGDDVPQLARPKFLAIVASATLAAMLKRKSTGKVDGFIIEGPTAGGHNAPPRGRLQLDENGEPIYGKRDLIDPADFRKLGLPFWFAGSYGNAEGLRSALEVGAAGIQVGTMFAFCEESGIEPNLKRQVIQMVLDGKAKVITDPVASPTGFPFKVIDKAGTMKDPEVYATRKRICDLGFLRHAFTHDDGRVGWRCPSEPHAHFERKGGELKETENRICVCNGLMATIGLGQVRSDGYAEPPLLTSGDALPKIRRFLRDGATSYRAQDVLDSLLETPRSDSHVDSGIHAV
ncbi:MAG: nitronate monooxygenase [Planctomycetota bacterium]